MMVTDKKIKIYLEIGLPGNIENWSEEAQGCWHESVDKHVEEAVEKFTNYLHGNIPTDVSVEWDVL